MASALLAAALGPVFDRVLPQPPSPKGNKRRKPVFPSGHAFGPGAVSVTAAYVLVREGFVPLGAAVPLAIAIPVITAGGKLAEEKHWASDVLGGVLGAIALAGTCLALHEVARDG